MKKILILLFILAGLAGYTQRTIVPQELPAATTPFTTKYPANTYIYLKSTRIIYVLDTTFQVGQTMNNVFLSGKYHLLGYEPAIGIGTTNQYWRGDKTWQTIVDAGGTVTSVGTSSPLTGGTITTTGTISIISDTLTAWWAKQNHGESAYGWGNWAGHTQGISTITNLQDSLNDRYRRKDTASVLLSRTRAGHDYELKVGIGTTAQYYRGDKSWQTLSIPTTYWTASGNDIYSSNSGNVGIGVTAPAYKLDVSTDARIHGVNVGGTSYNTLLGKSAMAHTTSTKGNVAIGDLALTNISTSSDYVWNTVVGSQSGTGITTGMFNTIVGGFSGNSQTSGNTLVGAYVAASGLGDGNTLIGSHVADVCGDDNVGVGAYSLYHSVNSSCKRNVAIGTNSISSNTTGGTNTAIGYNSLYNNSTGSNNTAAGDSAGYPYTGLSKRLYLGSKADSATKGIYGDLSTGKDWYKINGTLYVTNVPTNVAAPTYATGIGANGNFVKYAWPTGLSTESDTIDHRYVYNATGSIIAKGSALYTTGVHAGATNALSVVMVDNAKADAASTSLLLGLAETAIQIGGYGYAVVRGHIYGLNTNHSWWTAGDVLYLSDSTAGEAINHIPSSTASQKVRIGRLIVKDATNGKINVRIQQYSRVEDLANATITNPAVDEALVYDGTHWKNKPISTVSAGQGVEFYPNTTAIIAASTQNSFPIETLSKTPSSAAENVDAIDVTAATSPVIKGAYLYNSAFGRSSIDAGAWTFYYFASVSATNGGRVSSIAKNFYRVRPNTYTITTTGTGTTRNCKASAGHPFATDSVTASATRTSCDFVQTPKGLYQIQARNNDTSVTIVVPSTYTNESGVSLSVWKKLFGDNTGTITSLTTTYGLWQTSQVLPAYTMETKDKVGKIIFGISNNTTTINYVYQGTTHYSHINTPLAVLHDNLSGLNAVGGNYQHLTEAEKTVATQAATVSVNGYMTTAQVTALNAAAPLASPTFTGTVGNGSFHKITSDSTVVPGVKADGNSSTAITVYLTNGNTHTITRTGSCTVTLSGGVSGGTYTLMFRMYHCGYIF